MSDKEAEFNPWQWDREMYHTGQARLKVEQYGHEVALDHKGVSIDGQRIVHDDPSKGDHGFRITPQGTVVYRDQDVAEISAPKEGSATGAVTVWGKDGPTLPERRKREKDTRHREENDRRQRDERYRSNRQHDQQQLTHTHEQEMTL